MFDEQCYPLTTNIKHGFKLKVQGSEAKVYDGIFLQNEAVLKERFKKKYRHPELDKTLTAERIKAEVRSLNRCFDIGIKCPAVYFSDLQTGCIVLEKIPNSETVKELLTSVYKEEGVKGITSLNPLAYRIGSIIAKMHKNELVHGDLTTSNMLIKKDDVSKIFSRKHYDVFLIDFGLSKRDALIEDKAVDLYVLERAISSLHPDSEVFYEGIKKGYAKEGAKDVLIKLEEVRQRGRKRTMVG